jgi:mannose/fructose/N-acetylgalactosamine-specific phosphotransferase system component IID
MKFTQGRVFTLLVFILASLGTGFALWGEIFGGILVFTLVLVVGTAFLWNLAGAIAGEFNTKRPR